MAGDYKIGLTSADTIEQNSILRDCVREVLQSADLQFDAIFIGAERMDVDQLPKTTVSAAIASTATSTLPAPPNTAVGADLKV